MRFDKRSLNSQVSQLFFGSHDGIEKKNSRDSVAQSTDQQNIHLSAHSNKKLESCRCLVFCLIFGMETVFLRTERREN